MQHEVLSTLLFCATKLIPSVFPFMILCSVLCNTKIFYSRNRSKSRILDKCKNNYKIIMLSWISGYLLGPKYLCESSEDNDKTPLVFLTSNAGIGFVVSYIGITLWQSASFGIVLYLIQILSSILIYSFCKNTNISAIKMKSAPLITSIGSSVQETTKTVLEICGFTITINVLKLMICNLLKFNKLSYFYTILNIVSDISTGTYNASFLPYPINGFLLGFALGFGSIGICLQTFSICGEVSLSKKKFLLLKLLQGLICGALTLLIVSIFNINPNLSVSTGNDLGINIKIAVVNGLFIFSMIYSLKKILKTKFMY